MLNAKPKILIVTYGRLDKIQTLNIVTGEQKLLGSC